VSKLNVHLQPTGTAGEQKLEGLIYEESSGAPGALLGTTTAEVFKSTNPEGWYELPFPTAVKLAAGSYWIGFISGATADVEAFNYEKVTSALDYNVNVFTSGPSNPFGTPTVSSLQMSLYATYTAGEAPKAPVDSILPTISGTAETGQTLTATTGTWTESPTGYTYQWESCASGCKVVKWTAIAGATKSTYAVTGEVGSTLRVTVTASNAGGKEAAHSAQTLAVTQGPSTIGTTTVGPSAESDPANLKGVNKYELAKSSVSKLSIYLQPTGTAGEQKIEGVIYAAEASGGAPGALDATSTPIIFKATSAAGWYELPFATAVKLAAGNYWIGFLSGATANVAAFRYETVASALDYNVNVFTSGPSTPFGTPTIVGLQLSLYATYTAE
jgi:hypothetical protein